MKIKSGRALKFKIFVSYEENLPLKKCDWVDLVIVPTVKDVRFLCEDLPIAEIGVKKYDDVRYNDTLAFFMPSSKFKVFKGTRIGTIVVSKKSNVETLCHECTHAGYFYAQQALKNNLKRKTFKKNLHKQNWFEEAIPETTGQIFGAAFDIFKRYKLLKF